MPSLNVRMNLKKFDTKRTAIDSSQALLAGPLYTIVPTLFNVDKWAGFLVGSLACIVPAVLFDMPHLISGWVGAASTHLMYYGANQFQRDHLTGRYMWRLDPGATTPASLGDPTPAADYSIDRSTVGLPNGEQVYGYRATDLPSESYPALPAAGSTGAGGTGMNDYYRSGGTGMNDYYRSGGMSDAFEHAFSSTDTMAMGAY